MEYLHKTFLQALRSALHGSTEAGLMSVDDAHWQQIFALAQAHKVLPMVYETACTVPGLRGTPLLSQTRRQVMQQVMTQARKTEEFLELNRALWDKGIRPLAVKGIICRSLYPKPDLRPSSDEDLLIPEAQFSLCGEEMERRGMQPSGSPEDKEVSYRQNDGPLYIELHGALFPSGSDFWGDLNRFFDGAFDNAIQQIIDGTPVLTLCHTEHMLYLLLHALKHFLHSGFGIRQVCDIGLYAKAWGSQIDWHKVMDCCKSVNADIFSAAVFQIGEKHLGIEAPAVFRSIRVDETALLEDILRAGIYGSAESGRVHSSSITLDAAAGRRRSSLAASLFPPARQLEGRFPYLKKHPWLLPAAWVSRILHYRGGSTAASQALKTGAQRVELMKQYGIIEKV